MFFLRAQIGHRKAAVVAVEMKERLLVTFKLNTITIKKDATAVALNKDTITLVSSLSSSLTLGTGHCVGG